MLDDTIFRGSVLDLLVPFKPFVPLARNELWLDDVLPIGESGIEPFLTLFRGGAIGPDWSAFGGRGGREEDTCSSIAYQMNYDNIMGKWHRHRLYIVIKKIATRKKKGEAWLTFLWWTLLFGCLWYMSSHAKQNTWSVHCLQRTIAVAVPHKSQVEFEFISFLKLLFGSPVVDAG